MRGRRNRKVMRLQMVGGQPNQQVIAGTTAATMLVYPQNTLLGGSVGGVNVQAASKLAKDIMLHGVTLYSEVCCTGGTPGTIPFLFINESLWIDSVNWAGGLTYTPAHSTPWMDTNEWTTVNSPAGVPDKILHLRQALLYKVAGTQTSSSNNWGVHHVRVRRRIEQSEALILSLDVTNQDNVSGNFDYNFLAILHVSFDV